MNEAQTVAQPSASHAVAQRKAEPAAAVYAPAVDVLETKDAFVVVADLPGVAEGAIDITVKEHVLSLHARREPIEKPGLRRVFAEGEVRPVEYRRSFTLTDRIDPERIEATLKNGTLRLTIAKREELKPRRVAVQAAS